MQKLKDCTDQELLHSLSLGNRSAFIEIYERYWDRLLGVAFNRLNNIEDAEECVQDVFYKFWRNRREIELQNFRLEHYLARAIRNQAFNMLDKRYRLKHSAESVDADLLVTTISPEQEMIFKELERQFEAALQDLPAQCQFVFRLSRQQGLSNREIAEQLGISENTVKTHLKKADRELKQGYELLTYLLLVNSLFN